MIIGFQIYGDEFAGKAFRWGKIGCAQLRAELDAYYTRLYSVTHCWEDKY